VELLSETGRGGAPIAAATPIFVPLDDPAGSRGRYGYYFVAGGPRFRPGAAEPHRVQADTGCDRGVQRLHHGRDRNAGDRVARLAHESAQSLAFRTEHDDQRIGLETGFADQLIAAAV